LSPGRASRIVSAFCTLILIRRQSGSHFRVHRCRPKRILQIFVRVDGNPGEEQLQ
jgi:hypothetical protein